jgi:AcrR family transcriptional regulator
MNSIEKPSVANGPRIKPPGADKAVRRIVAGARRHFFAHGFRGVTMDDLAEELGMSKKTLYAHFPGKAALLEAVIEDKLSRVEADLSAAKATAAGDFPARLHALLACMKEHTEEIQPAFVRDVQRESPELFALVQEGRRKLIQRHFGKLLKDGRRAGTIRRDIPVEILIEILVGAVDAIINPTRLGELGLTPRTGFMHIISVFLGGVLVTKGGAKR